MQKTRATKPNPTYTTEETAVEEGSGTILELTDELLAEIDEALGDEVEFAAKFMCSFRQKGGE